MTLDQLHALCAKLRTLRDTATPLPWRSELSRHECVVLWDGAKTAIDSLIASINKLEDALLIVAAINALPEILAELDGIAQLRAEYDTPLGRVERLRVLASVPPERLRVLASVPPVQLADLRAVYEAALAWRAHESMPTRLALTAAVDAVRKSAT